MGADDQPHVLEPQPGLVERQLELAQRAGLVQAGVHQHHAVARGDRVGVAVRNAGPGQRQAQAPQPGQARGRPARALAFARSRTDQNAGVEHPGRVHCRLGRAERRRERLGALAVIPGPVVAADRVVVGDGAAGGR